VGVLGLAPGEDIPVNISKYEQRVLHALAQGGCIRHIKDGHGRIAEVDCFNRDGFRLADCTLGVFRKLKRRRLIFSHAGQAYRITREGLAAVRSQLDNR
jgi:uncharacterized protein YjhX (UPF0386 family)